MTTLGQPAGFQRVAGSEAQPPAVVIGLGYGGLNAARSLARLGVRVHGVHRNASTPASTSRVLESLQVQDFAAQPAEKTVDWLCELGEALGRPVCVAMDDAEAAFLARHRERLEPALRYPFVSSEVVDSLVDKGRLHELCREHGTPTPRTLEATSVENGRAFGREVAYPLVVKGRATFGHDPIASVTIVRDEQELDDLVHRSLEQRGAPVLQELLPWSRFADWIFHGYFDARSRCTFGMTAVKLLQHPRQGGRTVVAACVQNHKLSAIATDLFRGIGYRGIVDCDFRYDQREGTYKLLDANPRVGANFRTSVDTSGTDVVRALYLDQTGRPVPTGMPLSRRRWLLETDFPSTWGYVREGDLTPRQWLGTLRHVEEVAWFAPHDTRPFAAFVRGKLIRPPLPELLSRRRSSRAA